MNADGVLRATGRGAARTKSLGAAVDQGTNGEDYRRGYASRVLESDHQDAQGERSGESRASEARGSELMVSADMLA